MTIFRWVMGVIAALRQNSWIDYVASTFALIGYSIFGFLIKSNTGLFEVDEFWLDRKEGFCEHFAAAFVVVMRAAGLSPFALSRPALAVAVLVRVG